MTPPQLTPNRPQHTPSPRQHTPNRPQHTPSPRQHTPDPRPHTPAHARALLVQRQPRGFALPARRHIAPRRPSAPLSPSRAASCAPHRRPIPRALVRMPSAGEDDSEDDEVQSPDMAKGLSSTESVQSPQAIK